MGKDKLTELDLGFVEDAITVLINLVHIEIHSTRSYLQTNDENWLKINNQARVERTELLEKICNTKLLQEDGDLWCFTPTTKIILNNGIFDIKDIKIGDEVLTHTHSFKEVVKVHKRKINEEIIRLKTNYTNIDLEVTGNHLFYVAEGLRTRQKDTWRKNFKKPSLIWKKAEDLTNKDFLYLPRFNIVKDTTSIHVDYDINYNGKDCMGKSSFADSLDVPINNDVMRLIGLYLSEGHHTVGVSKKNGHPIGYIGFTFSRKRKDLSDFIVKTFKKYFNYTANPRYRESTIEFSIGKKTIEKFFSQFGNFAHNKCIPEWVLKLPNKKLSYLFRGLMDGDGSIAKFALTYSTVSQQLAFDIKLILNKMGIMSSIANRGKAKDSMIKGRRIISRHDSYNIGVSGNSARDLAKLIKIDYNGGQKTSGQFGYVGKDYFLIPIIKTEKFNYKGDVYNLSVRDDESYSTFNGVAHNCYNKHSLVVMGGYMELGNREYTKGNKEMAIKYFEKFSQWLGIFLIKNKLKGGKK